MLNYGNNNKGFFFFEGCRLQQQEEKKKKNIEYPVLAMVKLHIEWRKKKKKATENRKFGWEKKSLVLLMAE